jgi:hypothetical protein
MLWREGGRETEHVGKKVFVSLKAVAQRNKEGDVSCKYCCIGEDLTQERDLIIQKHEEHANLGQELVKAHEANAELSPKLSECAKAEKAQLSQELSKFKEHIAGLKNKMDSVCPECCCRILVKRC